MWKTLAHAVFRPSALRSAASRADLVRSRAEGERIAGAGSIMGQRLIHADVDAFERELWSTDGTTATR